MAGLIALTSFGFIPRTRIRRKWDWLRIVLLVAWAVPCASQAASPGISFTAVGLEQRFKVGCWVRVELEVVAAEHPIVGHVEIYAPDGDGLDTRWQQVNRLAEPSIVRLKPTDRMTLTRYIKLGRLRGVLEARLVEESRTLAATRLAMGDAVQPLYSTQEWLVVIGPDLGLSKTFNRRHRQSGHRPAVTYLPDTSSLPEHPLGYDGIDTLVIPTSRPELLRSFSSEQRAALQAWLLNGGRAIFLLGREGPRFAGENGIFRPFVPAPVTATTRLRQVPGLETFAHAEQPLPPIEASVLVPGAGVVTTFFERRVGSGTPAIIRYPLGLGRATLLTFDLDRPPFDQWDAASVLWAEVLHPGESEGSAAMRESESRRVTHIGYDEMAGQLRSALDDFSTQDGASGVRIISFTAVAVLLGIYILLIGPGDFFLLKRVVGRMEWTWLTFPLMIIACAAAITYLGHHYRGGRALRMNQVDLVDIDETTGVARGITWAHLYSPATRSYSLSLLPEVPLRAAPSGPSQVWLSWQGLPGSGLGGFDTTAAEALGPDPYTIEMTEDLQTSRMVDVPISTAATKSVIARWNVPYSALGDSGLQLDRNGFLKGTIRNPFTVPLQDVLIAYDRWAYRLDRTLNPGEDVYLEGLQRRDLEWRLTRRRILSTKTSYASTPWDPQSRDVPRILEIMMFHKAAGGESYTGLRQHYQSYVDLSEQLVLGRAVLIGAGPQAAGHVQVIQDSKTPIEHRHWTWYRLVLSVQPADEKAGEGTRP